MSPSERRDPYPFHEPEAGRVSLSWTVFDMNGTLLDLSGVADALGSRERFGHLVEDAFQETILLSMADTLSGGYRPLAAHLRAALQRRLRLHDSGLDRLEDAIEAASRMRPFPDAHEAIEVLREAGLSIAVCTNSTKDGAVAALRAAGLAESFDAILGSDEVGVFKPHPDIYRHALSRLGLDAPNACMIASHGWDLMGASRAGMRTAWVARGERHLPETIPEPDVRGADLRETAQAIVTVLAG